MCQQMKSTDAQLRLVTAPKPSQNESSNSTIPGEIRHLNADLLATLTDDFHEKERAVRSIGYAKLQRLFGQGVLLHPAQVSFRRFIHRTSLLTGTESD